MPPSAGSLPGYRPPQPQALLGLREAVAITVGLVIGAGTFKVPVAGGRRRRSRCCRG